MEKYSQGDELGYNKVDPTYSGSMSTKDGETINEEPPAFRTGWVCPQCSMSVSPKWDICPNCQTVKANEQKITKGKTILNG
jgi:rubrerythrin